MKQKKNCNKKTFEGKTSYVGICALLETERKGNGSVKIPGHILIYSNMEKQKRAVAGVVLLISDKYEQQTQNI